MGHQRSPEDEPWVKTCLHERFCNQSQDEVVHTISDVLHHSKYHRWVGRHRILGWSRHGQLTLRWGRQSMGKHRRVAILRLWKNLAPHHQHNWSWNFTYPRPESRCPNGRKMHRLVAKEKTAQMPVSNKVEKLIRIGCAAFKMFIRCDIETRARWVYLCKTREA